MSSATAGSSGGAGTTCNGGGGVTGGGCGGCTATCNYACLQALVNNNTYMTKQLCYHKLQSKNIRNLFVLLACNLAILKLTM